MVKTGRPKTQRLECLDDGCERATHARGRCKTHYNRWLKERAKMCKSAGCQGAVVAFGLCGACDKQKRRTGSTRRPNGRRRR